MSTRRSLFWRWTWAIGLLTLSACSNENSSNLPPTSVTSVTQIPVSMLSLPPGGVLSAYVTIDNDPRIEMTITGDTATTIIPGLSRDVHNVLIEYEFTDSLDNTYTVASKTQTVDLSAGDVSMTVAETDYETAKHDDDGDGLSNAEELALGTDPSDAGCILGSSLIGSCTL